VTFQQNCFESNRTKLLAKNTQSILITLPSTDDAPVRTVTK